MALNTHETHPEQAELLLGAAGAAAAGYPAACAARRRVDGWCSRAGGPRATSPSPRSMIPGTFGIFVQRRISSLKIDEPFASLCACGRSVVSVCGSCSVIELVGLWSPCLVGGDTFQSLSVIITIKAVTYNTLRQDSRSPFALGRRSHIGALRHAFMKLQRQGRAT